MICILLEDEAACVIRREEFFLLLPTITSRYLIREDCQNCPTGRDRAIARHRTPTPDPNDDFCPSCGREMAHFGKRVVGGLCWRCRKNSKRRKRNNP